MKILIRIISFPFIIGLSILAGIRWIIKFNYSYIKYGGEFMIYERVNPKTVEQLISEIL